MAFLFHFITLVEPKHQKIEITTDSHTSTSITTAQFTTTNATTTFPGGVPTGSAFPDPGQKYPDTESNVSKNDTEQNRGLDASKTADLLVGTLTCLLIIVGFLDNVLSVCYFWRRSRKTVYDLLYLCISAVDLCACLATIPVAASLLNERKEALFQYTCICQPWPVIFDLLLKTSTFLVMVITVYRTAGILFPSFNSLNNKRRPFLVVVVPGYCLISLSVDIIAISNKWAKVRYQDRVSFCELFYHSFKGNYTAYTAYTLLFQIQLLLPSFAVLLGLVTGAGALLKRNAVLASDARKFRKASLTISIFAGVFLACNLPCLVTEVMYATLHYRQGNIKLMVGRRFYRWYGHLLSHVFLPVLNGVLNPCIYLGRMTDFRAWIKRSVKNMVKNSRIHHSRSNNSTLSPKVMNEIPNSQYIAADTV